MAILTFILGGARSGKSTHALHLAQAYGQPVTFIATATAGDDDMRQRIQRHQAERPADWQTIEAPWDLAQCFQQEPIRHPVVILDCLTMLISNLLMRLPDPEKATIDDFQAVIDAEINSLETAIRHNHADWFIISNEVGLGVVPAFKLGRLYRDGLGRANQHIASIADHVLLMVAGLPMQVK
jgi:adenosylcobinamide kinase/adenosylcobinamide-phosphate guanylyltransferase